MLPGHYQLPAGAVLLAVGLLSCFAGYRLFRAVLTIYGFILGALFASTLAPPSDTVAMLISLAAGGVLGAVILYIGFSIGVALVGAGLGATLAHTAWLQWKGTDPGLIVIVFFAIAGAVLAVKMQRAIVSLATAFLGAQTAVAGAVALITRREIKAGIDNVWIGHLGIPAVSMHWTFIAFVALAIVGCLVQFGAGGKKSKKA